MVSPRYCFWAIKYDCQKESNAPESGRAVNHFEIPLATFGVPKAQFVGLDKHWLVRCMSTGVYGCR